MSYKREAKPATFLKQPCPQCPFRNDIAPYLTPGRVRQIEREVIGGQQDFHCHKTTGFTEPDDEGEQDTCVTPESKRCAGMAILCEKLNRPTQMMRIEERLGFYDRAQMKMDAPVFNSFAAMAKAQRSRK